MKNIDYHKISHLLEQPTRIVVTSHHNPDGDAVGSAMAMYHILKQMNHDVDVILPNNFPDFLAWIDGSADVLIFEGDNHDKAHKVLQDAAIIFCLDYNAPSRVGKMEESLRNANGIKIMIDHHPNPDAQAFDHLLSNIQASSTAELVYQFIEKLDKINLINPAAAESLYTGIITDTGSFSYSCNSSRIYRIVACLVDKGVDAEKLHRLIYDNFSESRIRLLGYAISEKMVVLPEYHTAYISLSRQELEKFNYETGDTEGIVNYPLSIRGINMSILLTEREKLIRLSFRSKGDFGVNEIAKKYFEGGGHQNAAGGDSYISMKETEQKIREILPLYKEQLDFTIR